MKEHDDVQTEKLWTLPYCILMLSHTATSFSFYMITTILAKYLTGLGASLSLAGTIVGLFSITSLVFRPVSGIMADSIDKKKLLFFTNILSGLCVMAYGLSSNFALIVIIRIVHGAVFGISSTTSVALTGQIVPKSRMGQGVGYLGLGQIVSAAVAPGMGIALAETGSITVPFIVAGIVALSGTALLLLLPSYGRTLKPGEARPPFRLRNLVSREVGWYALISGLFYFTNGVVSSFLLLVADGRGITGISMYYAVNAAVMFAARPIAGRIMDKKGLSTLLYPCFILGTIGMALHGLAWTLPVFLVASALRAIAQGSILPSLQAASIMRVDSSRVGVASSTYYLGGDIGQGIGPIVGGVIATQTSYDVMFYFCALLVAVGGVVFFLVQRSDRKKGYQFHESG